MADTADSSSRASANEDATTTARDRRAVSQTLDRGLAVINAVAVAPEGLTVSEVADRLSSHRTIVVRLLNTLADWGYVTRSASGRYILGPHPIELARLVKPMLRLVAQPALQRLADDVGATAHLTTADGEDAVALLVVEPRTAAYHISYRTGSRRPLTKGASGFAILGARPPGRSEMAEVANARRRGWAMSVNQIEQGTWGVAASLGHPQHTDLSVGLVYLGQPHTPEAAAERVIQTAREIRDALG
ncbi:IclR family transcriptional regulator [Qaidamihabitans albus]|uniref:IclR family transcriptional regulator n=1 Tax=Qaidamihabitans albus TaxID=2795733 RepID=UPI0018F16CC7|nr:helix-turn-helix domain-containing protein [Qaidamihabitans albus]